MKSKLLLCALLVFSCGCSCMNNTEAGALTGGIFGGALGTIAGAACGRPLAGAAIGAAGGTAVGALAGNCQDRREARETAAVQQAVAQQQQVQLQVVIGPMGLQEIATLAQQHYSDAIIINQIRNTGTTYNLRTEDIQYLKEQGVSDAVVVEMQSRRHPGVAVAPPGGVTVVQPVYTRPVYVAPPPVAVGVGFGFGGGRRW